MINVKDRKRRSEAMTPEELAAFNRYIDSFSTKLDASNDIGISRQAMHTLRFVGSGRPETIELIRKKLKAAKLIT